MLSSLMLHQDSKTGLLSLEKLVDYVFLICRLVIQTPSDIHHNTTIMHLFHPCFSSGVLYHPKAHSQSTPVLKIHLYYKDKSIYVSGYGVLDAKRVSSVVLEGDKLNILSGKVTYNWASSVRSLSCMKISKRFYPCVHNYTMQVFVSIGDELKFKVFFNHDNLDIVWSDVSSFNHSSHGILGKYLALVVR